MKRSSAPCKTQTYSQPTMVEVLLRRGENLVDTTENFLRDECKLVPINSPGDSFPLITWKTHYWSDLTSTGKQAQPVLLTEFRRFADLLRVLSRELPSEPKQTLIEHLEIWCVFR